MSLGWATVPPIPYVKLKSTSIPGLTKYFNDEGDFALTDGKDYLWAYDAQGNAVYHQTGLGSIDPNGLSGGDKIRNIIAKKFKVHWLNEHDPEFWDDEDLEDEPNEPIMASSKLNGPSLEPGHAFRLNAEGQWDIMKVPPDVIKEAKFSGFLLIKGVESSVFEGPDGTQWAQKTPPSGLNISTRLVRVAMKIAGIVPSFRWVSPDLEEEEKELAMIADEEGLSMPDLWSAAHAAKLRSLSDMDWQRLEGTDSYGMESINEATHVAEGYGRDADSVIKGMVGGAGIPAPIVLEKPDGSLRLVSGNARLMAARALGLTPDVLWIVSPS